LSEEEHEEPGEKYSQSRGKIVTLVGAVPKCLFRGTLCYRPPGLALAGGSGRRGDHRNAGPGHCPYRTLGLVVFLEVWPVLATYAPAIFPALAVVGALNLAMISRQEQREAAVEAEKAERRAARRAQHVKSQKSNDTGFDTRLDTLRAARMAKRDARITALMTFYTDNPKAGVIEAGRAIGVSRQTVYNYLAQLEENGRVSRNNGTVKVLETSHERG
jgi:hypothetical protein